MASLDVALYQYVTTYADLLPLLSGRLYPLLAPEQAAMPFVVYTEIAYRSERHMLGVSALKWATYQWDVYAARHQECTQVRDLLTTALDGLRGLYQGVSIRQISVRERRTTLEDDQAGGQQMYYRSSMDIEVCYYT